jgi:hypothetical protein
MMNASKYRPVIGEPEREPIAGLLYNRTLYNVKSKGHFSRLN